MSSRDRRPMYGSAGKRTPAADSRVDVESLEQENDHSINALSERIGLLKAATSKIRNEAESQHTVLDRMTDTMFNTGGMLGGAADKFKMVMNDKQNKKLLTYVGGIVVALLLLYYLILKR